LVVMTTTANTTAAVLDAIRRGKQDRFWTARDLSSVGHASQIDRVLARLASQHELRQVRRGLYWRGAPTIFGMSRPSPQQIVAALVGENGIGPAGLSAANDLGLTTQVPAMDIVAIPRRPPRPVDAIRFVDRSARVGRRTAGLHATEVAIFEVLGDWERLVEVPRDQAEQQLIDLLNSDAVRPDRLVKASRSEPSSVRNHLRSLLVAAGRDAAASRVPEPYAPTAPALGTVAR
jgi:hypothetical protein